MACPVAIERSRWLDTAGQAISPVTKCLRHLVGRSPVPYNGCYERPAHQPGALRGAGAGVRDRPGRGRHRIGARAVGGPGPRGRGGHGRAAHSLEDPGDPVRVAPRRATRWLSLLLAALAVTALVFGFG